MDFELVSRFKPTGDQPTAIKKLTTGLLEGKKNQVLLGVTGSGKTFSMANVIQKVKKPTLVISHNKTLAAQLYQEFRDFFPNNAVSYFVSYYDYYQPEAYMPTTDTYIEKEAEINEEIDRLRLSATANLLTRNDVIVVASVSCIYNLGSPVEYGKFVLELAPGVKTSQRDILVRLADLQYERNDYEFKRGSFRVRGGTIELLPAYMETGIRFELGIDSITSITEFDPLTGEILQVYKNVMIYPAKHYMTDPKTYDNAFAHMNADMEAQAELLKSQGKLIEAQRIRQRTTYDIEMIKEVGYVNGIENYSTYFDGRKPGEPPYTLIDYFDHNDKDWLLVVDESHITLPQIRGMYNGDRSRKQTLIDYGFRLPSALDNRPLKFDEFMRHVDQAVYVSATPEELEISLATEEDGIAEQLIRPTGIVDPSVTIKPSAGQIPDLMKEITKRTKLNQRILVTTLTKRMAEELSSYLEEHGIKVAYLHSDIITLERQDILDQLRSGEFDVLVGINLLREGLDLPEVTLVAILDADKEGFLRSRTSLIQTMGRAARNIDSEVIMYADKITKSMKAAIDEVERRREIQIAYNKKHNITPINIDKAIRARLIEKQKEKEDSKPSVDFLLKMGKKEVLLPDEKEDLIKRLRKEMKSAAEGLDFETATLLRDQIRTLQGK
jgi:excinuclease ABC subunit B